jgi:hypothetical protein
MLGFFKKNVAQAELAESKLKVLIDEVNVLKSEIREGRESIEKKTSVYELKDQDLEKDKQDLHSQLQKIKAEKDELQDLFNTLEKDHLEIIENRQRLMEKYINLEALRKTFDPALRDRAIQIEAEKNELQESFNAMEKDRLEIVENRQHLWEEYQKLEISRNEWQERFHKIEKEIADLREQGLSALVTSGAIVDGEVVDIEQILEDQRRLKIQSESLDQENGYLLIQIHQNRDEIEKLTLENKTIKHLNYSLSAKWHRLERRLPNYIDYGGLEVISVDGVAIAPKIVWKITDYSKADLALPEFYFQTTLQNGQAGISIINSGDGGLSSQVLIPAMLSQSQEQREIFLEYSLSEWNKISAACNVLEQLIINNGVGLGQVEGFDLSFWKGSLVALVQSTQRLPKVLRFDRVRLKRELVNPNYEHLWLEFYDVQLDTYHQPKLEIRLAAALVQSGGFSRFPKIEIPLVDGKEKPFDSWYSESHDDQGAKLEIRFALDKQAFDFGVFTKLSALDQRLVQSFIYRMPAILNQLAKSKVSIHRQWQDWYEFARATVLVMQTQLAKTKAVNETGEIKTHSVDNKTAEYHKLNKPMSIVKVTKRSVVGAGPSKTVATSKKKTVSRTAK